MNCYNDFFADAQTSSGSVDFDTLTSRLVKEATSDYRRALDAGRLMEFEHGPAVYLHAESPAHDARTVLAIGRPEAAAEPRDDAYQRGYPLRESVNARAVDRGHFLPYSAGGLYGPNLYVQDRALNRGWSREGRAYRRLERLAVAATPNSLIFCVPRYIDTTAVPAHIDLGVVASGELHVQTFRNRYDAAAVAGQDQLAITLSGATDRQIGDLGEETASVLLETVYDATIIAMGDAAMERDDGRQHLDLLAVVNGELLAFEVKTRYTSARAGRTTRAGNLARPRLRRASSEAGHRQGSQQYVAARMVDWIDVGEGYAGIDVRVIAIDLVAMLAQQFSVDDAGVRLQPMAPPVACEEAARQALETIMRHRECL